MAWIKLQDGTYQDPTVGRIIDPRNYSEEQLIKMGIPIDSKPSQSSQQTSQSQSSPWQSALRTYEQQGNLTDKQKLEIAALGGSMSEDYRPIFQQGFERAGQPENSPVPASYVISGTQQLAESYIDRYFEKTGKLPTEVQVRDFVATNLTPSFAKEIVTNSTNPSKIKVNLVDPYIQNEKFQEELNKPPVTPTPTQSNAGMTSQQINELYAPLEQYATNQVRQQFAPLRARAVDEEAALGRLRSGVARDPGSMIGQVDANQGNALSSVIGNILGQKASGTLDLGKFNAGLDLSKQQLAQSQNQFMQNLGFNQNQFNQTIGLQKQQYADAQDLQRQQLNLAKYLGQLQGKGKSNNGLSGGLGGAAGGAATGTAILPGWGTAIGGLAGGLMGYFGSRED